MSNLPAPTSELVEVAKEFGVDHYEGDTGLELLMRAAAALGPNVHSVPHPGPPVVDVVAKVAERCNLACTYCYMYFSRDQSWREKPRTMDDRTFALLAANMRGYAQGWGVPGYGLTLHGGEPLLRNPEFFEFVGTTVRRELTDYGVSVEMGVQTNATLITRQHLEVFARHNIRVGVSLDGGKAANDRHRNMLGKRKSGSFESAQHGLELLLGSSAYKELFNGFLCVVDVENNPIEVYKDLCQFNPSVIDFLLPLGNWQDRPPHRHDNTPDNLSETVPTPYGDWLVHVFDRWAADKVDRPSATPGIRFFTNIIAKLHGVPSSLETLGASDVQSIFVDTDGSLHAVDAFKTTAEGITDLGVVLEENQNKLYFGHRQYQDKARQLGMTALPRGCGQCDIKSICGGGYAANRYAVRDGRPTTNLPSVYHPDLARIIRHIQSYFLTDD